jgi:hypothetical protein
MRNKILSLPVGVALVLLYSAGALLVTPSPAAAQDRVQLQVFMLKLPTGRGKQTKHTPITVYIGVIAQSGVWLLNQAATRSTSVTSTPSLNFTPVITLVK